MSIYLNQLAMWAIAQQYSVKARTQMADTAIQINLLLNIPLEKNYLSRHNSAIKRAALMYVLCYTTV